MGLTIYSYKDSIKFLKFEFGIAFITEKQTKNWGFLIFV